MSAKDETAEAYRRLIDLSTIVSGNAQLLVASRLDAPQKELVTEMVAASQEMAAICDELGAS